MGRRRKDQSSNLPTHFFLRPPSPTIFFWYEDELGRRKPACSKTSDIAKALKVRAKLLEMVQARRERGIRPDDSAWSEASSFIERQTRLSKGRGRFHRNNLLHAKAFLSLYKIEEIKRPHVRAFMEELMGRIPTGEMAPRTVRHVYDSMRRMFNELLADGVLEVSPCTLEVSRGELPAIEDKDPEWRDNAVFDRDEVLGLITDPRVRNVKRVAYALSFISGMRDGELVNRRWRDYNPALKPLGELRISTAWSHENRLEKLPKSKQPRRLPVHPVLAAILAEWRLSGWAREYGRPPTPDDFIIARPWPLNRQGKRMDAPPAKWKAGQRVPPADIWKWLNGQWRKTGKRTPGDLERLGLRPRRAHDTRRTFISLCLEDGGNETILRHITHGRPKRGAFDLYPTFTWEKQCEEVKKLRLAWQRKAETSQ